MADLTDVVVVGGGVLGTALAYELSRRTLRVVLLEEQTLAGGATGGGFAWVNATSKADDESYCRLSAAGVARYDVLATEIGRQEIGLYPGGSLHWAVDDAATARLQALGARLQALGCPVTSLRLPEMRVLEPDLEFGVGADAPQEGLFSPADRWVNARRLVRALANAARGRAAEIRERCPATGFQVSRMGAGFAVETPQGIVATRFLVLAAGLHTPALLRQILGDAADTFAPVRPDPGLLLEITPAALKGRIHRVLYPPDDAALHLRPTPIGGILAGADDTDAAVDIAVRSVGDGSMMGIEGALGQREVLTVCEEGAHVLLRRVRSLLPGADGMERTGIHYYTCWRPMPFDERPLVGAIPDCNGLYVAVTHSGVTLGPLLAQYLADEIVSGRVPPDLTAYRPGRRG